MGHLLVGSSIQLLPEPDVPDTTKIAAFRYKHLQLMIQNFWKRWSLGYINSLQQRHSWKDVSDKLVKVGDMVLLKDDNVRPYY